MREHARRRGAGILAPIPCRGLSSAGESVGENPASLPLPPGGDQYGAVDVAHSESGRGTLGIEELQHLDVRGMDAPKGFSPTHARPIQVYHNVGLIGKTGGAPLPEPNGSEILNESEEVGWTSLVDLRPGNLAVRVRTARSDRKGLRMIPSIVEVDSSAESRRASGGLPVPAVAATKGNNVMRVRGVQG